jgi:RNA 3'-terminal phosphate cyclase (ATP)
VRTGDYSFDVSKLAGQGSAGAVSLLLQTILLPLALADGQTRLILAGGTHVAWSPPVYYVDRVLFPALAYVGLQAGIKLLEWGWYPRGGGCVEVTIEGGAKLKGVNLNQRGALKDLEGVAVASNLPAHIPQRISARANNLLRKAGLPPGIRPIRAGGPSTGAGIFTALAYEAVHAGYSVLGVRGKPSEEVAEEAVNAVLKHHRQAGTLDPYLPDQIIPALVLAEGDSKISTVEITGHTLTNVAVIQRFVDRPIKVIGDKGQPGVIRIE